jgi:hypothetical protein
MQEFDARQCEILKLMGVDVWRLRADPDSAAEAGSAGLEIAHGADQESVASGHWHLTLSTPGDPGGPLIVRDIGDTVDSRSAARLTAAIASALGSASAAACLIDACQTPADASEPDGLPGALQDALSRWNPTLVIALGQDCGHWLSRRMQDCGVTVPRVLVADDLATLLTRPERKAALWQRFLSMDSEDAGG